jgi:hypothetical protein
VPIVSLSFSADGSRLACAGVDVLGGQTRVNVVDAATGRLALTVPGMIAVAFGRNDRLAVGTGSLFGAGAVVVRDGSPRPDR